MQDKVARVHNMISYAKLQISLQKANNGLHNIYIHQPELPASQNVFLHNMRLWPID